MPLVEVGCDYFMVDIIGAPDEEVISLVTQELIPKLNGA